MFFTALQAHLTAKVTHGFFTKFVPSYITLILTCVLVEDQSSFLEYYFLFSLLEKKTRWFIEASLSEPKKILYLKKLKQIDFLRKEKH